MACLISVVDLEAKDEDGEGDDSLSGGKSFKARVGSPRREASSKLLQTDLNRLQSKPASSLHLNKNKVAQRHYITTTYLL